MIENIKSIISIEQAHDLLIEGIKIRANCAGRIKNAVFTSKTTGRQGTIVGLDNKQLYLDLECWEPIGIKIDNFEKVLDVEDEVKDAINTYIESFKDDRKLNRLIYSLWKKEEKELRKEFK